MGNIVGNFAKAHEAHDYLNQTAEQGDAEDDAHADGFGQLQQGNPGHGNRAERGKEHKGRGIGGPGGKKARRTPEGRHDDGQHAGINAVLRRHARNDGVGHCQRRGHGRQGQGRQKVTLEIAETVVGEVVQKGKEACNHGHPREGGGRKAAPRSGGTAGLRNQGRVTAVSCCWLPSSSSSTSCPRA